jgi:hypothetical protein
VAPSYCIYSQNHSLYSVFHLKFAIFIHLRRLQFYMALVTREFLCHLCLYNVKIQFAKYQCVHNKILRKYVYIFCSIYFKISYIWIQLLGFSNNLSMGIFEVFLKGVLVSKD